jgi:Sperm-tail PG-rich repeat
MPAFSLGKSKRNDGINPINVPGPGSYSQEVHSIVEHSPKWTMSSVKKEEVKNIVPGPGAYNSNLQIIKVAASPRKSRQHTKWEKKHPIFKARCRLQGQGNTILRNLKKKPHSRKK